MDCVNIINTTLLSGRDHDGNSVDGACFALHSDVTHGDFRLAVYVDSLVLLGTSGLLKYLSLLALCFHCWEVGCWLHATWGKRETTMHTNT